MSHVTIDRVTDETLARERGAWRAVVYLPADMAAAPGVSPDCTGWGPWVEGFGAGPSEALRDAVYTAGLALLGKMEGEERRAAEVELREKPARIADALGALEATFRRWREREREAKRDATNKGEWGRRSVWDAAAGEVSRVRTEYQDGE